MEQLRSARIRRAGVWLVLITVSIRGTATAYSSDQELEKVIQESHYAPRYSHERLEGYADVILDK